MSAADVWLRWDNCKRLIWISRQLILNDSCLASFLACTSLCEAVALAYPICGRFHTRAKRLLIDAPLISNPRIQAIGELFGTRKSLTEIIEYTTEFIDSLMWMRRPSTEALALARLANRLASILSRHDRTYLSIEHVLKRYLDTQPLAVFEYVAGAGLPTFSSPHLHIIVDNIQAQPHAYHSEERGGLQITIGGASLSSGKPASITLFNESREELRYALPIFDPLRLLPAILAHHEAVKRSGTEALNSLKQAPLTLIEDAESLEMHDAASRLMVSYLCFQSVLKMVAGIKGLCEPSPPFVFVFLEQLSPRLCEAAKCLFDPSNNVLEAGALYTFTQRAYKLVGGHCDQWVDERQFLPRVSNA